MARRLGKSRTAITESLSLNGMPDEVKNLCRLADIHSKSLLLQVVRQNDPQKMVALVEKIARDGGATREEVRKETAKPKARPAQGLRLQLSRAHQGVQAAAALHEVSRRSRAKSSRHSRRSSRSYDRTVGSRQSSVGGHGRQSGSAVGSRASVGSRQGTLGARRGRRSAVGFEGRPTAIRRIQRTQSAPSSEPRTRSPGTPRTNPARTISASDQSASTPNAQPKLERSTTDCRAQERAPRPERRWPRHASANAERRARVPSPTARARRSSRPANARNAAFAPSPSS